MPIKMGNSGSTPSGVNQKGTLPKEKPKIRNSTLPPKTGTTRMPMPDKADLDRRFNQVLASMDLPPDKARVLKNYDDDKKWEMVCDQENFSARESPQYYLNKLRVYLDPTASKSAKKRRMVGDSNSTQVLRNLEISLRTNHIEWVRDFLSEENKGLDVLIDYLSYTQLLMRREQIDASDDELATNGNFATLPGSRKSSAGSIRAKRQSKMKQSNSKLNFGDATDDVHVCILCLRAIMNHQYGFNLVFAHNQAMKTITLSLNHRSLRTKSLVLELIAAVCLVSGGHAIVLQAFDHFKEVCEESLRFESMMHYFMNYEEFHIDFMVCCMQFINILVHSVEDVNFRVHLQHEFTLLGLDSYLNKLRNSESGRLGVHLNAYRDNMIDVATLLEDSDMKNTALEKVAELEESLSHEKERCQEIEEEALAKVAELEKNLNDATSEIDSWKVTLETKEAEFRQLLKEMDEKEEANKKRQSLLEDQLTEMERIKDGMQATSAKYSPAKSPSAAAPAPPPPAPPPPPPGPPPPIPGMGPPPPPPPLPGPGGRMGPPAAPPAPGMQGSGLSIKKKIQPKHRLPVLNWVAMKPNQVKGTVFSEIDDEALYDVIDFYKFEEMFRLGTMTIADDDMDGTPKTQRKLSKRIETITLLEPNRLRNVGITRRKIQLSEDEILRAINNLDLKILSLERVEILQRIVPNETEIKAFREYEASKKPIEILSEEDKFIFNLMRIERLSQKLTIMSFIGNFFDTYHHLQPQLNAVIAAAMSIKNSQKMKKMLEIILAFGNYMNSSKRGAVYGFKLQSFDMLLTTKSSDKKQTLLHFIVQTVKDKFPELANFESELRYIEKAATVSLENIIADLRELENGMEMTRREYEARKDRDPPLVLKDFLNNSEDKLRKLHSDAKTAQEAYSAAVEYFGENSKTLAPNTFFSLFARFIKAYKQAEVDLATQAKLAAAANEAGREKRRSTKGGQEAVVTELKRKQRKIQEKKVMNREDVYHGALEDILLDLKNEPYRRADGVRRSQRRRDQFEIQGDGETY